MRKLSIQWVLAAIAAVVCAGGAWGQAPVLTGGTLPQDDVGIAYPTQTLASGGTAPYTWNITSGAPPAWASLNLDGTLSGNSPTLGSSTFTATVTDSSTPPLTSNPATITITINPQPRITTSTLPGGDAGPYSSPALGVSGGTPPFTFTPGGPLPAGTSLNTSTGAITGSISAGAYSFSISVTDSVGGTGTSPVYSVTINPLPAVTTTSLPPGEATAPYAANAGVAATGGTPPYTWSVAPPLPPTLTLNPSTGAITGTLSASATTVSGLVFKVTDSLNSFATSPPLALTVTPGPSITTATMAPGDAGSQYSQSLAAANGTPPYTWAIPAASLPPGINLNPSTGALTGTTTVANTYTLPVTLTDSVGGTASTSLSLSINQPLTISTAPMLNGTVGVNYSQPLAATGGAAPYTWAITVGQLPGGLQLVGNTISGTPTASGAFTFTVQVTDSISVPLTKQFTITIASGLTIVSGSGPTLPPGIVGQAYSDALSASGGTAPYTFLISQGGLPAGLKLSTSGAISGTPTEGGTFNFTVTVTDSNSVKATQSFSLSIAALLAITTQPVLPSGGVGTSYTEVLTAVGGTGGYTWSVSAGALPGGLSLSPASGTISGSPTTVGSFSFTVQVRDSNQDTTTQAFTLSIVSALTITTQPTLHGGAVNVGYSQSIVVVGGNAPYTWSISAGALPAGLTLAPASGAISGTPTAAGNFTFTVQVVDAASVSVNKAFSIAVVAGLTITTAPILPSDSVGVGYAVTLAAAGGSTPYTWAVSAGGLPGGLTLDAKSGSIFGTPTASGSFTFTVKVTDNASNTATKLFSIAVAAGLTITTAPVLPNGAIGASYSQTLDAVGGAAPYSWSVSQGALPGGVTLSPTTGMISGTPAASGTFNFTVQVTDTASATATKLFALTVSASLTITTPATLPSGSVGVPYSFTFNVAGGTGPYQWTAAGGALPSGLALDASTGVLTGTPLSAGAFTFSITVSDTAQHQASQQFNVTIASGLVISSAAQLPAGSVGNPYSQTLSAAGGTPPYHWTVASGALPAGLALSSGGVLGGIPTANGTFQFTAQVTDSAGGRASLQFSLSIGSGLAITSGASLPSGTLGQAYTPLALAAAGGRQPYTWAVTSGAIAPGLALSAAGTISGTPTSAGAFQFTVQVTDSNRATATLAFTISILPPALPQVNISGVPETATSADQIDFSVALGSGYPLAITGTVTLTFAPDAVAPADDPAIQLSTGGRTANFTIAANATKAVFPVPQMALQTGTVSGTVTLAFTLEAGGTQLPASGLTRTITIGRAAPVISAVKLVTSSNTLQVQVTGYSSPRELTEADVTFTAASGSTLQTTSAIIDLTAVGKQWFQGSSSAQYGSQFVLVMPFTATQGSISAVGSVSVVLKNSTGASPASSASF